MTQPALTRTRRQRQILGSAFLVLALGASGCKRDQQPSGQSVATVNGEPVTTSDLQLELNNVPADQRKAYQPFAIQSLVDRKLLAQYAKTQGVDRNPEFVLQLRRLTELLLAQRAAEQIAAGSRGAISSTDVNRYLDSHPAIATGRRRLTVDQLQFPAPDRPTIDELNRAQTLEEVTAVLQRRGIRFVRGQAKLDTATLPANVAAQFDKLKPGEPLVFVSTPRSTASAIVDSIVDPIVGDQADALARERIAAERAAAALQQRGLSLREQAKIAYAQGYSPTANKIAK